MVAFGYRTLMVSEQAFEQARPRIFSEIGYEVILGIAHQRIEEGQAIILGVEPVARRAISNIPAKPQTRKGGVLASDQRDRKSGVEGKSVAEGVDQGGRRR